MEKQIIELAKKYGYHGLFSKRDNIAEVQDYIEKFPKDQKMALYTVMGITLNTLAYNRAKAELDEIIGE